MGINKHELALKLGVPAHKIKNHNINHYFTRDNILCCKYDRKPINNNIEPYEFNKAIGVFADYYKDIKSDYYKNLLRVSQGIGENILDQKPNEELDHVVQEFVKFRPNTFVMTLWPNCQGRMDELMNLLNKNGKVYYVRKINLNYNGACNLIYHYYSDMWRLKEPSKIKEKVDYIGWSKDEVKSFKIVVYEHMSSEQLSGGKSPFKTQIRNIWARDKPNMRADDFVHINDNFYQTIEYLSMLFNKNTLKMFHHVDIAKHLDPKLNKCRIYLNTVKQWLVKNVHPIDLDRFVFMGSMGLFTLGIRGCRDVDGICSQEPQQSNSEYLFAKLDKYFFNYKKKFFFAEINVPGTRSWKSDWDEKDKPWLDSIDVEHKDQLIFDPAHYFYYNGLKCVSILDDVKKRLQRRRYTDFVDIYVLNNTYPLEIDYPTVPNKYTRDEFEIKVREYIKDKYPNESYETFITLMKFN